MAYMNNVGKFKYSLYLVKQNKKLIILLNVILAIMICGIEGILLMSDGLDQFSASIYTVVISAIFAMIISMIVPLYMMKMLYHKKSSDFYYALPIKRKDIYFTHLIFGFLVTMLPIVLYYIVGMLLANASQIIYDFDLDIALFAKILVIIIFNMFVMQAMINFIAVRCNNLVDALILIGCYMIIPFVLLLSISVYFDKLLYDTTLGFGNYLSYQFIMDHLLIFLSVPTLLTQEISKMFDSNSWDWHMIYWFVVAVAFIVLSARYYVKRKAEQSESISNFHMGYPLVIVTSVLCIMLIGFGTGLLKGITIVVTLLVYFILLFIWKRKIYLNVKSIGVYVFLLVVCVCLQFVFEQTNGFNSIQEVPTKDYKEASMEISVDNDVIGITGAAYEGYVVTTKGEEGMKALKQFHQDVLPYVAGKGDYTDGYISVSYGKNEEAHRLYYLTRQSIEEEVLPRLEKLKDNKKIEIKQVVREENY